MAPPETEASDSAAPARLQATAAFAVPQPAAIGNASPGTSTLRRDILVELRRGGPTSPEQLAIPLGARRTGALPQLPPHPAARPPLSSPRPGPGPAGRAPSSSPARSRPPASSTAGPSATASAGRVTCTT